MSKGVAKIGASELPRFRVGDRIRLSEVGKLRTPRTRIQTGKVVRTPKANEAQSSIEVLFDGNKTPTRIHKAYVEIDGSRAGRAEA